MSKATWIVWISGIYDLDGEDHKTIDEFDFTSLDEDDFFEICVIRSDNYGGMDSYGWEGDNKMVLLEYFPTERFNLLMSEDDPDTGWWCYLPTERQQKKIKKELKKFQKMAQAVADVWNEKGY